MNSESNRKPGRPKVVTESLISVVLSMYRRGLGYRAIARELTKYGVLASFSSVRRVIKRSLDGAGSQNALQANSDTILKLTPEQNPTQTITGRTDR